jgi:glycosyl transferase family 25
MNKNILFVCYPVKNIDEFNNTNNLFNFIDKVIYINLKERLDRKESITKELSCFPENKIIRFDAIKASPGYIGCSKSHIAALEMAIQYNWKNVLIVEDDMVWKNFDKGYNTLKNLVNEPYDVILLGAPNPQHNKNTLKLINGQTCTAYLVSNHYFKTLLDNFKEGLNYLITTNIYSDYAIDQYWKKLQTIHNWYVIEPALSIQKESYSDIHNVIVNYEKYFN